MSVFSSSLNVNFPLVKLFPRLAQCCHCSLCLYLPQTYVLQILCCIVIFILFIYFELFELCSNNVSILFIQHNLLKNCILLIILLQLSWFSPFALLQPVSPTPSGSPSTTVHAHWSCMFFCWLHFLYCTLYPHGYLITTYLYIFFN